MGDNDEFSVTVSCTNEGSHDPSHEHLTARSVNLSASGTLLVDGKTDGKVYVRTFHPGLWDSFEVKRISAKAGDS
ncbi:hypothetical protein SAMN05444161_7041 [Rhizobiales bacterium GAS191]|nr:hypothetical protein SAMN05444161_7041 [Rhizobiales bacterium GAS191]